MKTLSRYVLAELLQVFLLTLAGLTALIFVALIAKEAVKKGLGVGPLLRMTPYLLPQAMQFAVPGTMLLATTNVYGRLSAANEVIAAKSLGISPWALTRPTLVLATLTSLGAVAINDAAVSWGRNGVQRVFLESFEEVIYRQLQLHRSYADNGVQITVRRVVDRRLIQPTVTVTPSNGESWTISSASAELASTPDRRKLLVRFDGIHLEGDVTAATVKTLERAIDLDGLLGGDDGGRSASDYALSEIAAARHETRESLEESRRRQKAEATLALLSGDLDRLSDTAWAPLAGNEAAYERLERRLRVEPYRRWADGFACLCFVMVGVPMAILRQRGEFLASFFLCFLPILLAYYPLLMLSVDHAKTGEVPPIAVWLGNVVLAVWGLWMMRRVVRH